MSMLFVGERRSPLAVKMGVRWEDGNLAAKQLFDALEFCGINPLDHQFTNWFEYGGKKTTRSFKGRVIAMGRKVQDALRKDGITFTPITHPAARGKIRLKANYLNHIKEALT